MTLYNSYTVIFHRFLFFKYSRNCRFSVAFCTEICYYISEIINEGKRYTHFPRHYYYNYYLILINIINKFRCKTITEKNYEMCL